MPAVRSRIALLCVASATTAVLALGGGTAFAAADPVPGTQACRDAVNLNTTVQADRAAVNARLDDLNTARANGVASEIAKAQSDLDAANAKLRLDIADVTDRVCTGTATTDPVTPVDPPVDNGAATFDRVRALIAQLECDADFNSDQGRIADLRTAAGNGLSSQQQGRLTDLLNARLDTLNNCVEPAPAPTTVTQQPTRPNVVGGADVDNNITVNPTEDDGSVADTDGSQIEVVPNGSASTGAA